jgi:hypothetical protein
VWEIKCAKCNTHTCLELEFPDCLVERPDGSVYRACKKCKSEIYPRDGKWVAQYPDRKDTRGRWISQLNSAFIDPKVILQQFRDPPNSNVGEFYNSTLGMAYIAAENRLTPADIYPLLDRNLVQPSAHPGPCAMGVDVGTSLHTVIGDRLSKNTVRVVKIARLSSFNDLYDLATRFNVKCAVIDLYPETRKVREFAEEARFEVFGCQYQEDKKHDVDWNQSSEVVTVGRTEVCDATHDLIIKKGRLILPRQSEEVVEHFIPQMCNMAKVLQEDDETGLRKYRYRKLGMDHYRHAMNYFHLASQRIGVYTPKRVRPVGKDAYAEEELPQGSWLGA